jgi:hypothetical protein
MAGEKPWESTPGVLVPDGFTRTRRHAEISARALCSTFLDDRDLILISGSDRHFVSRQLLTAFSPTVAAASLDKPRVEVRSRQIDRLVRLFQGETVFMGGQFDVSAAVAELKLRGFAPACGQKEAGNFRLLLEPEFVRACFGEAKLRVNGKEVAVSEAGLLLLRQSE